MVQAQIQRKIANEQMKDQQALAVRNLTQPNVIMSQAEQQRMISGAEFGKKILNSDASFRFAVHPKGGESISSGTPEQWMLQIRKLGLECQPGRGYFTDEFRNAILGVPQDVLVRMNPRFRNKIVNLKRIFSKPQMAGLGLIGKITPTQYEDIKGRIKRDFLETISRAKVAKEPSDKMNRMRMFWDKWQPTLSSMPGLYNWFKEDVHIKNSIIDFKGWDTFTPEESKYLESTTSNTEREFLSGNRDSGVIDATKTMYPIADWDVEDLMPNVPSAQPNLSNAFDIEDLMPGVYPVQPDLGSFEVERLMPGVRAVQPKRLAKGGRKMRPGNGRKIEAFVGPLSGTRPKKQGKLVGKKIERKKIGKKIERKNISPAVGNRYARRIKRKR
jgi:hypothetical protein